ncbi:MAG: lipid-A-disaccharide synthase [Planctomycetota bacterium]|nr:lipid-A-disaccharide synthase [Planctomycetota bacterium]
MKIFFSVGEPSGDIHGANLIHELRRRRPEIQCVGYGGPKMAAAGCELHEDLTALAVMWILRVLLNIHKFLGLVSRADRYFQHEKPDAVILIDYPGFNWWIARRAKRHGIPVFYYSPPQIWAWAGWRIKKMRRLVDHVLCGLPFEEQWFGERGCKATFVGHPYFDEVRQQHLDNEFISKFELQAGPLVTILPGSRTQEVTGNLEWLLKAASLVRSRIPQARFAVAAYKTTQATYARKMIERMGLEIEVYVGKTPELIHLAHCCMAVSGSVSLELLFQKKPTVILYYVSRFAYFVQGFFRKVKYITLVNLLNARELFPEKITPYDPNEPGAERVLFPEYLTCEDKSAQIAGHIIRWLVDVELHEGVVAELAKLKARVGRGGASKGASEYILNVLEKRPDVVPRPHFVPGMKVISSGDADS